MPGGDIAYAVLAFVVAVGVLVTVHEFGHFWVARRLGVKVLRFSVGFGRPLLTRRAGRDGTEYVVAAIPLGGYVKMLDEREGPVPEPERHRAFNRKGVYTRIAIVAAGPAFNFLFAVIAYWLMFLVGVTGVKPIVGGVDPGSAAAEAGFAPQDRIVAVAGERTPTWEAARFALLEAGLDGDGIEVEVIDARGQAQERILAPGDRGLLKESDSDLLEKLGLEPWRPAGAPVIVEALPGGAAERAGLQAGDVVLSVDGEAVGGVGDWIDTVEASAGRGLLVTVERDGRPVTTEVTPDPVEQDGEIVGKIRARMGARLSPEQRESLRAVVRHGPFEGLGEAVAKTWDMSALTLRVLGKLVVGEADIRNISGPITIAQYAGISASLGLERFLSFLAVVSISLGILNLLPIPVLDGGHLLYYAIEIVKGRPLSEAAELIGQRIGLVILLLLMTVAFYNDILRLMT